MKKILSIVLVAVVAFLFVACGIEVEYYTNTEVPTFTCVTGISCSNAEDFDAVIVYTYNCDKDKKESLVEKYVNYLKKECGYVPVEYDDGIQLVNGGNGVLISALVDDMIVVMPYDRAD